MKLVELNQLDPPEFPVVTSGTFDGVHVGHQKILQNIVQYARKNNGKTIVITFWPHPRFVLKKNAEELKLLTTFEEKAALVENIGIDFLVRIPFTKEFSRLTSEQFIQQVLVDKIRTRKLVIGYDHRFGNNREGGFDYLKENSGRYGFEVEEIPRQDIEHVGVSSSKIREAISNGEVHVANEFLGRHYAVTGFVKDGDRIGRSIGFPTANIDVPEQYKLIPADGAYAVFVELGQRHLQGMLNVGQRPTVSGRERRIEVNIFNFDEDIYNQRLTIRFVKRLRAEKKFNNLDQLKEQLDIDKQTAYEILSELS